ncbi:MAG: hypothetical protein HOP15_05380 [Planctomycetes bacterium]|nr:hypothetical protein [Planctomycetota bacterium]
MTIELVPPSVSSQEIEREFTLEVELENEGRFFAWELLRGRAWIRNVASRSHRIVHPGLASLGLVGPGGWPSRGSWSDCRETLELGPGERVDVPLARTLGAHDWRARSEHDLELVHVWNGRIEQFDPEKPDLPAGYGAMADVPTFELRTRAFRIVMESPLTVELVPLAPVPSGRRYRLSEILRLELRNVSDKPVELASSEAPLEIEVFAPDSHHRFKVSRVLVLPAHGELELTSDPELGIDAWSENERIGARPRNKGQAYLRRKGWVHPVSSRPVKFDLR